jgi:hypothetical protein
MSTTGLATRHLKDPSALTKTEMKIWELKQKGLGPIEIVAALGLKSHPALINSRLKVIREKLACAA